MAGIIVIYVILIVIFLIASSLIFRHAFKFSYLSPRFKIITISFGIVATSIIILSIYILIMLNRVTPSAAGSINAGGGGTTINSSGFQF